jgi:hypothetical protein
MIIKYPFHSENRSLVGVLILCTRRILEGKVLELIDIKQWYGLCIKKGDNSLFFHVSEFFFNFAMLLMW